MKHLLRLFFLIIFVVTACTNSHEGSEPTNPAPREILGVSRAALTVIDTTPSNATICCFGHDSTPSFGQTITVPAGDTALDSFSIGFADVPASVTFRGEVYAWGGEGLTGPNLYESAPTHTTGATPQAVTFNTGGIVLTAGATYVLFVTTVKDEGSGDGALLARSDNAYAGGAFFYGIGNNYEMWGHCCRPDLAFTARFVTPSATTTTLTSSVNPSAFGQSTTFTATVSGGASSGTVTFKEGSATLGTASVNGAGQASLEISNLSVGTHAITAAFGGTSAYLASTSAPLSQVVKKADTSIALSSSTNPSITGGSVTFTATVTASSPGAGTPSGTVTFRRGATTLGTGTLGASGTTTFTTTTLPIGTGSIVADYGGDTSFNASTSPGVSQVVSPDGSTVALTASPEPSTFGASVTFKATVSSTATGGTPTGTVTFSEGSTVLGTGTLDGSGVATFSTAALTGGTHTIHADYGGDTAHNGAAGSVVHTVSTGPATVTSATLTPASVFGQSVTFAAKVTGTGATPSGTVTLVVDGTPTAITATLDGSGQASLAISTLSVGNHSITIKYGGDTNFSSGTSNTTAQTVSKATTSTALASSSNPSIVGGNVTFTATVKATAPGAGTRSGTVTFKEGATTLGTGTLDGSGVASFVTNALTTGTHAITAVYSGDTNFVTSTSSGVSQVVNVDGVSVAVGATPSPSTFGTSVTFTATVTSSNDGGTPTGTVTFKEGATTLGTGNLDGSGVATSSTTALTGGMHTITAEYGGDTNHGTGTGTTTHEVDTAASTTALTSSVNPSVFGESTTLTATVTSTAPGTATGTVTFFDGATSLGTVTLDAAGVATFTTSGLSLATHALSARYSGDSNYATSTGTLSQVVGKAQTTTAVTSSQSPSLVDTSVTFTATVSATAPGAGTTTGTVAFKEGSTTLGTGTLDGSGTATFSTSSLAVGAHTITAEYGGDGNFEGSASAAFTQDVSSAAATVALVSASSASTFGESVTFSAQVSGSSGTPTGTVTFSEGSTRLGTGTLDASGLVAFATVALPAGTHTITATYGGSSIYATATASVTHVVRQAPSTITVASSKNPSTAGEAVTFTATITSSVTTFTGTVEFFDGATSLGVVPLNGSTATVTVSTLTIGDHAIAATFSGDANVAKSSVNLFAQTVRTRADTGPGTNPAPSTAPPVVAEDDGCGCRVTGAPSHGGFGAFAALVGATVLLAKRRRR